MRLRALFYPPSPPKRTHTHTETHTHTPTYPTNQSHLSIHPSQSPSSPPAIQAIGTNTNTPSQSNYQSLTEHYIPLLPSYTTNLVHPLPSSPPAIQAIGTNTNTPSQSNYQSLTEYYIPLLPSNTTNLVHPSSSPSSLSSAIEAF